MKELKPLDYKLLFELMKNSRRSDRTLAKVLKTSQPTVTRRRARLEKDFIDGYTAIPKWEKLGYEILAITLVKSPLKLGSEEMVTDAVEKSMKWLEKQPNVIFDYVDGVVGVCLHFRRVMRITPSDWKGYTEWILKREKERRNKTTRGKEFC